jgi:flagellar motility protein MotE (MotC chaperone)
MIGRPSLLLLTAGAAGLAVVANATTIATGAQDTSPTTTRLGNAITQDMNDRDAAAARRKRGLDLREQAAKAASARLAADAEARKKQEETQQQMAGGPNGMPGGGAPNPADSQFDELARIYQAMKPKAAAVVFEQLDMEVQMKVASRMRERSTAMIMAAMTPKGAATLSMAMARRSAGRPQAQAQPPVAARAPATPAGTARR